MNILSSKAIGVRPFFYSLHKQPVLIKMGFFKNESFPVADNLSENGFYIPSGLGISDKEISIVSQELIKLLS